MKSPVVKRSVVIASHKTSVSLEDAFWKGLKEIAGGLNLSVKTVEAHKFNLMRKLDIHNKAQLVQYAIQKKIIQIPSASA